MKVNFVRSFNFFADEFMELLDTYTSSVVSDDGKMLTLTDGSITATFQGRGLDDDDPFINMITFGFGDGVVNSQRFEIKNVRENFNDAFEFDDGELEDIEPEEFSGTILRQGLNFCGSDDDDLLFANSLLNLNGNNRVDLGKGDDRANVGGGTDVVNAGRGNDTVWAGAGNDILRGGVGVDHLYGQNGDDIIRGNESNDKLWGGDDNDRLFGGAGRDILEGGNGFDELTGGEHADLFVFKPNTVGQDRVLDYNEEQGDMIRFTSPYAYGQVTENLEEAVTRQGNDYWIRMPGNDDYVMILVDAARNGYTITADDFALVGPA